MNVVLLLTYSHLRRPTELGLNSRLIIIVFLPPLSPSKLSTRRDLCHPLPDVCQVRPLPSRGHYQIIALGLFRGLWFLIHWEAESAAPPLTGPSFHRRFKCPGNSRPLREVPRGAEVAVRDETASLTVEG